MMSKLASNLGKAGRAGRFAGKVLPEAVSGASVGSLYALSEGRSLGSELGTGVAFDVGLGALGTGIRGVTKMGVPKLKVAEQASTNKVKIDMDALKRMSVDEGLDKLGRKVGVEKEPRLKTIKEEAEKFYADWVNRFHAVEKPEKFVEETIGLSPKGITPSTAVVRLLGAGGVAELRHNRELKAIMRHIDDIGIKIDHLDEY